MLHSHAPQKVPFAELGSRSSNFGVFMSECWSNMDNRKKCYGSERLNKTLTAIFQYLNDKDYKYMNLVKVSYVKPILTFHPATCVTKSIQVVVPT